MAAQGRFYCVSNAFSQSQPNGISLLSIGSAHFHFGLYGCILIFYSKFDKRFCKLRIKTLIRRHLVLCLTWVCTVYLCPTKNCRRLWVKQLMNAIQRYWQTMKTWMCHLISVCTTYDHKLYIPQTPCFETFKHLIPYNR